VLDTVVTAETPEGILLELRPAGLSARFYALAIDWLIRLMVLYAAAIVAALVPGIGVAFWLVLAFALEWLYPIAFELSDWGATPGKRVMGLKVVMDNGLPVAAAASVSRNLLRVADFLPFGFAFGVLAMVLRRDGKRLGDIAAGTLVVHAPRSSPRLDFDDVVPIPPVRPLSQQAQAAIIALATRAPRLTIERVDELAALAATVSGDEGNAGPDVTRRVLGVAHWCLGRRP
jgi:uncharacterized RDD family membrane protein YckC